MYVFSRQLNLRSPSSLAQIREWRGGKDSHMKQTDRHTAGSMVLQRNKMFALKGQSHQDLALLESLMKVLVLIGNPLIFA